MKGVEVFRVSHFEKLDSLISTRLFDTPLIGRRINFLTFVIHVIKE